MLGGALAGGMAAIFVSPLDVARVRIQVSKVVAADSGLFGLRLIQQMVREEGFLALYRGLSANMIALVPNWMAYFVVYTQYKQAFEHVLAPHIGHVAFDVSSAVVAGAASTLVTHPLWLIKARMQVQGLRADHPTVTTSTVLANSARNEGLHLASTAAVANVSPSHSTLPALGPRDYTTQLHRLTTHIGTAEAAHFVSPTPAPIAAVQRVPEVYKSTWHAVRTIVSKEGPIALYHGLTAQLLGLMHVAIHFPCYEALKRRLRAYNASTRSDGNTKLTTPQIVVASTLSKVFACAIAYPHEVIRSRFQTQDFLQGCAVGHNHHRYANISSAVKQILRNEGVKGLYQGLSVTLFRSVPACIVTFVVYESVLAQLNPNK